MINKVIHLKEYFPMLKYDVKLTTYCVGSWVKQTETRKRKAVLLLPAGGYRFVSRRENEPVALRLVGEGINVFSLDYTVAPFEYPYPLVEAYAALAYIRQHSDELLTDPNHIGVMGFSAGGHLAASISCYKDYNYYSEYLNVDSKLLDIQGCLLGYPVISMEVGDPETILNITQGREELRDYFSIDKHITSSFPKTFIFVTAEDKCAIPENSLRLASSLIKNNVFCEMHIYPKGFHGLSLSNDIIFDPIEDKETLDECLYNEEWFIQAIHFIKEYL